MERGLFIAFWALLFWGLLDACNRYAVTTLQIDPWLLSSFQMLLGGLGLFMLGGSFKIAWRTLHYPHTWAIGIFRLTSIIFYIPALVYISATEAEFITRIGILISIVFMWIIANKRPTKKDIPGLSLVTLGLLLLILRQENSFFNPSVIFLFLAAFSLVLQTYFVEKHPIANQFLNIKNRASYTGVILMVVGFLFLVLYLFMPSLEHVWPNSFIKVMPKGDLSQINLLFILISAITGLLLRAPAMYLSFLSIRFLKTDNYLLVLGLLPFATLSMESIFSFFGLLDMSQTDIVDIGYGLIITLGALWVVIARTMQQNKDTENA